MIKVLRIINRFNVGGPVYNATYLSAGLPDNFETLLIGAKCESSEGDALFIPRSEGVEPVLVEHMQRELNPIKDRKALKEIRALIRGFKPDIVHTHASKAGALGRRAARLEGVPLVVHTFHGNVFKGYFGKLKTTFYKSVERKMAKASDAIVAISQEQKRELVHEFDIVSEEKCYVIPLGFNLSKFRENSAAKRSEMRADLGFAESAFIVGIIGRLVPIKNHQLFFDAIRLIANDLSQKIEVCVVGDGELRKDLEDSGMQLSLDFGINVYFAGWQRDVDKILAGLDIVALTSLNEGTPVSLIEAQAAGVPVVTTNVGGVSDVVDHGNTGLIVEGFSPKNFGLALKKLIEDKDLRSKMTQKGWDFVREKFSERRLCADMAQLYNKLLKEKRIK